MSLLPCLSLLVAGMPAVAQECDDLPWADPAAHVPAEGGTNQTAYSWHVHYTWQTDSQHADVSTFEKAFCEAFAKNSKNIERMSSCGWGPNYLGDGEEYMCSSGQCDEDYVNPFNRVCGSGTCPEGDQTGPWSVCQGEFFVPSRHIDEVTAWLKAEQSKFDIVVMRHPNTGCQWGDHFIRAQFFSDDVPEMCLWGLPCNDVGFGCKQGMCGHVDGTKHIHQHASGCYNEIGNPNAVV